MNDIIGSSDSSKFYRGDKTWSNILNGRFRVTNANGTSGDIEAYRGDITVWLGIGSGNENHGVYSSKKGDWIVYSNASGAVTLNGNAATATKVGYSANWLYVENSDEINFGGTHTGATIYFGYRAKDSRPKPTNFNFGNGAATLTCGAVTASGTISCANATIASGGRVGGSGGNMYIGNSGNQGWVMVQDICSHSGAGDSYWSARVAGTLHANSYVTNSSIKIKKNIEMISDNDCLKLLKLHPITFEYKENLDNHLRHAGFIAEDVETIMPEIVLPPEDEKSLLGIRYIEIIAYTIKLLQIQNQEIENLKSRIDSLENK